MASSESRLQPELEDRLRFEQIISDLSAQLIHLPFEQLNDEIELALKKVLAFFQVDRCALLQVLPDKNSWKIAPPVPIGTRCLAGIQRIDRCAAAPWQKRADPVLAAEKSNISFI
jgi:hypothetical protein